MEKLFLVIERIPGYYDEPDAYELKGFFTTPEAVAELKVSTYCQKETDVIVLSEENLNKKIDLRLSSYFGSESDDVKILNYAAFLKEYGLEIKEIKLKNKK